MVAETLEILGGHPKPAMEVTTDYVSGETTSGQPALPG